MTKNEDIVSEIKRDYIFKLASQGDRVDGRKFDEIRQATIKPGVISRAEGSAEVALGNTRVIAGIKVELGEPFPDTPDRGVLTTNIELVPMASPTFESGPPGEDAIELARVVDRGIRESEAIDMAKLVIEEGGKVWIVFIDIHVLDYDGNLFDASGLAAMAALKNTVINGERHGLDISMPLPVQHTPVPVTFVKIGDSLIADPTLDEELIADSRITVTTDENGDIRAMQKSMGGLFTREELGKVINMSREIGARVREQYL